MDSERRIAVVGATGFLGTAVVSALEERGTCAIGISAPRIVAQEDSVSSLVAQAALEELVASFVGAEAVVNVAGLAAATGSKESEMFGANAALPGVLARACRTAGVRFIHVSSAAVQGRKRELDTSSGGVPTTTYAKAKRLGEVMVHREMPDAVVYRPAGVHGRGRGVTRSLSALARSPFSAVARPGNDNAPQALVQDVADAIAFLALHPTPPTVVCHPPSGLSTSVLLEKLGGRQPKQIPRPLARAAVSIATAAGRLHPAIGANARRLEILWFGQRQAESWLTNAGWRPLTTFGDWVALSKSYREPSTTTKTPTKSDGV